MSCGLSSKSLEVVSGKHLNAWQAELQRLGSPSLPAANVETCTARRHFLVGLRGYLLQPKYHRIPPDAGWTPKAGSDRL